jgi:hypothetical protein
VANQIEGLEILTDKVSSLAAAIAGGTTAGPSGAGSSTATPGDTEFTMTNAMFQNVTVALDLNVMGNLTANGALTVIGDANFLGNVKFGSHISTDGQVLAATTELGAGDQNGANNSATATIDGNDISGQVSVVLGDNSATGKLVTVNFSKQYTKAPKVILTPANGSSSSLQYYVTTTKDGFTITVTGGALTPGDTLQLNYIVIQ